MTNNIAKLYELAEVYRCNMPDIDCSKECEKCEDYNPFTPEKQLELIKWLCKNTYRNYFNILFGFQNKTWYMECDCVSTPNKKNFEESLAILTVSIWNDLTDKQRNEIKEILK